LSLLKNHTREGFFPREIQAHLLASAASICSIRLDLGQGAPTEFDS
jgi:hypothetical protein